MSDEPTRMTGDPVRAGFCAILGLPNVGKSTLLNQILEMRLVAVSSKPQTTRNRILGVKNLPASERSEPAQIIFFDTPGVQRGRSPLRRYMRDEALSAAGECDVALLMIDCLDPAQRSPDDLKESDAAAIDEALSASEVPILLAINKIDRLKNKADLLPILEAYSATGRYAEIIPISAQNNDGIDRVLAAIAERLPIGPMLFPEDMVTDRAERFLAAELIREQLFRQLGKEVPYATAVTVESFEERPRKGDVVISAVIHVERDTQKGIVVGKGGARIKQLGQRAREAISQLLGCPAHVKLFVRVSKNWSQGQRGLHDMGYE